MVRLFVQKQFALIHCLPQEEENDQEGAGFRVWRGTWIPSEWEIGEACRGKYAMLTSRPRPISSLRSIICDQTNSLFVQIYNNKINNLEHCATSNSHESLTF